MPTEATRTRRSLGRSFQGVGLWSTSQNIAASRIAASVPRKPIQNQGERMDPNILMRVSERRDHLPVGNRWVSTSRYWSDLLRYLMSMTSLPFWL